jgi:hypothetical protein
VLLSPIDLQRAYILTLKQILDESGESWTIKKLVAACRRGKQRPELVNSRTVERLAKQLNFPIKKDKVGRPFGSKNGLR